VLEKIFKFEVASTREDRTASQSIEKTRGKSTKLDEYNVRVWDTWNGSDRVGKIGLVWVQSSGLWVGKIGLV